MILDLNTNALQLPGTPPGVGNVVKNLGNNPVYYGRDQYASLTDFVGTINAGATATLVGTWWVVSPFGETQIEIDQADSVGSVEPGQLGRDLSRVSGKSSPFTTIRNWGHSIAFGDYASNLHGYAAKLAQILGIPWTQNAIGGSNVVSDQQAPAGNGWKYVMQTDTGTSGGTAPYLPGTNLELVMYGMNDLATIGPGVNPMLQIQSAMRAVISRLRAATNGIFEDNAGGNHVTYSAAQWTSFGSALGASGNNFTYTSTNGATVTIAVPADFPGGTIALGFDSGGNTNGATYTVTVDGAAAGSLVTNALATAANKASNNMPAVMRLKGLAPGAHTIVITVSAITGLAAFDYWQIEPPNPPLILVIGQPRVPAAGYANYNGQPFVPNDGTVQQLNVALAALVAEYDDRVRFIDLDTLIRANTNYFSSVDNLHPNDVGHSLIATACLAATQRASGPWLPELATAN